MYDRAAMLKQIQEMQFILLDLNLYLDNHPTCKRAVMDFNAISNNLDKLTERYEMKYGPLMANGQTERKFPWAWVDEDTPWPWERI